MDCECSTWCRCCIFVVFFFKQKTAYEMRISDWSSDVCSSDLWCGRGDRDRALDQRAVYRPGKKGPYRAPASGDGFELVKIAHRRSHASIPNRFASTWSR